MCLFSSDWRTLHVPTGFKKLVIDMEEHLAALSKISGEETPGSKISCTYCIKFFNIFKKILQVFCKFLYKVINQKLYYASQNLKYTQIV